MSPILVKASVGGVEAIELVLLGDQVDVRDPGVDAVEGYRAIGHDDVERLHVGHVLLEAHVEARVLLARVPTAVLRGRGIDGERREAGSSPAGDGQRGEAEAQPTGSEDAAQRENRPVGTERTGR